MAGGNFMHRVISYVVNELVVNGLANSNFLPQTSYIKEWATHNLPHLKRIIVVRDQKTLFHLGKNGFFVIHHTRDYRIQFRPAFQRFAVRTSRRIDDISTMASQKRRELAEQMKDLSKNLENSKK